MSEIIDVARVAVDAQGSADWERFRNSLAPDSVYDEYATGRRVQGADAVVDIFREWKQAFPDVFGTVTNALESGDTAILEVTWQGTQTGELIAPTGQTIPPSGKRASVKAVEVVTVEGGKVTENRHYFDLMGLLAQIDAIPSPASA